MSLANVHLKRIYFTYMADKQTLFLHKLQFV